MQAAQRQSLIGRADTAIANDSVVVRQLTTHQGMLGLKQSVDHSINGCAVICLLVISLYLSGVFGVEFIIEIARIIEFPFAFVSFLTLRVALPSPLDIEDRAGTTRRTCSSSPATREPELQLEF